MTEWPPTPNGTATPDGSANQSLLCPSIADDDIERPLRDTHTHNPELESGNDAISVELSLPQQRGGQIDDDGGYGRLEPSQELKADSGMLRHQTATPLHTLRRRKRARWTLVFYLPLLILPWAFTCIMSHQPFGAPRYIDATGRIGDTIFRTNTRRLVAINVVNSVAAVLTVPVTSLVLAEAAVVYLQRRDGPQSHIPLTHFYDIADRGWTDASTIWSSLRSGTPCNAFLLKSAMFLALCAMVLPLQQLLVQTENAQVVTCGDVPYLPNDFFGWCPRIRWTAKTNDAQIRPINVLPLWDIKEEVRARLITDTGLEQQASIWTVGSTNEDDNRDDSTSGQIQHYLFPKDDMDDYTLATPTRPRYWLSAVPNGTTTGVLRQHALRLNSSISCERISFDQFPDICYGLHPFTASFRPILFW